LTVLYLPPFPLFFRSPMTFPLQTSFFVFSPPYQSFEYPRKFPFPLGESCPPRQLTNFPPMLESPHPALFPFFHFRAESPPADTSLFCSPPFFSSAVVTYPTSFVIFFLLRELFRFCLTRSTTPPPFYERLPSSSSILKRLDNFVISVISSSTRVPSPEENVSIPVLGVAGNCSSGFFVVPHSYANSFSSCSIEILVHIFFHMVLHNPSGEFSRTPFFSLFGRLYPLAAPHTRSLFTYN